jgi:hypothetical protein
VRTGGIARSKWSKMGATPAVDTRGPEVAAVRVRNLGLAQRLMGFAPKPVSAVKGVNGIAAVKDRRPKKFINVIQATVRFQD